MKKIYFAMLALFISASVFSQGTITGSVTDAELGVPLPGANVVVQGTTNGTTTDFDGNFIIEVAQNKGTLLVSYIGFVTKKVNYTALGSIGAISLAPDAQELEGVVVTGIMDIAKDRETPVAVSTIRATEIR